MLLSTLIMAGLAIVLVTVGYMRGEGQHMAGIKTAVALTLQILPLLCFALIVAGMVQVLIPQEAVARWVGNESGFKGILIGSIAGGLSPGGPFVSMPIAAGFMRAGAGVGTMVAYLTGWSVWSVARLPMEAGILGVRFMLIRLASSLILPPLAGLIAQVLFKGKM